jgi:tRNA(adenine34) deaminase
MRQVLTTNFSGDASLMKLALQQARDAGQRGEVPVGAIIVRNDQIVGSGYNRREELQNPIAHAEIIALDDASRKLGYWRLTECDLYVTLEPCIMCAGAILQGRLRRVIFGCLDPKAGAVISLFNLCDDRRLNHRVAVTGGVLAEECANVLSDFFSLVRQQKRNTGSGEVAEPG